MKNKMRSIAAIVAAECILIAMACFMLMNAYSPESGENVGAVMLVLFFALAVNAACIFVDCFKIISLASFVMSLVAFCMILSGRISYLAFFFSGDVMGTGLSLFLILAVLFMALAIAGGVVAVCSPVKQREEVQSL